MKIVLAGLFIPLFATLPLYAAGTGVSVRLGEVKGAVSARASSTAAWTPVKDGVMLAPGSEVKTERGASVVLAFSDNNKVKLEQSTTFGIEATSTAGTSLRLFTGKLTAWVRRANKAEFKVRHAAGVAAVRGTVFSMFGTEADMGLSLFSGALDLADAFGRLSSLTPGQSAQVNRLIGLVGIAALPPAAAAVPVEPAVPVPPAPAPAATAPAATPPADSLPAEPAPATDAAAPPPPSPVQNAASNTTSPSSP